MGLPWNNILFTLLIQFDYITRRRRTEYCLIIDLLKQLGFNISYGPTVNDMCSRPIPWSLSLSLCLFCANKWTHYYYYYYIIIVILTT